MTSIIQNKIVIILIEGKGPWLPIMHLDCTHFSVGPLVAKWQCLPASWTDDRLPSQRGGHVLCTAGTNTATYELTSLYATATRRPTTTYLPCHLLKNVKLPMHSDAWSTPWLTHLENMPGRLARVMNHDRSDLMIPLPILDSSICSHAV
jgi:hypothetical protein